jgi:hypothetical protein
MSPTTPTPDDMMKMWGFLMDRVTELAVNQEALRMILEAHDLVRFDEFARERDAARERWRKAERASREAMVDQTLRRLLESFPGTKQ